MAETYIKQGGSWGTPVIEAYVKVGGVWVPQTEIYQKQGGVYTLVFTAEVVVVVSANLNSFTMDQLFSPSDWTSNKNKRVIINNGVSILANTTFAIATQSSALTTGWGGVLTLENHGAILGMGGAANSGVGGNAMFPGPYSYSTKKLIIQNYGYIWSGGGGGGHGGNGGNGQFSYTASEGPFYNRGSSPTYWFSDNNTNGQKFASWNDTFLGQVSGFSFVIGGVTYFAVTKQTSGSTPDYYSIRREYPAVQSTTGGAGGNGGRGQGSDGGNAAGSGGAAGGQNAGTGGTGGTGGAWGSNGNTGNTGGSGNVSGGSAGTAGGLAGIAYSPSWYTLSNIGGDIRGRIV